MINLIAVENNKQQRVVGNIVNDIYLLPRWEILQSFSINQNKFFFSGKSQSVNLLRKLSPKNMLEKYSVRTMNGETLANMDLRVYKDCVYIVNFEINTKSEEIVKKLIETAVNKAVNNTTDKEVFVNVSSDWKNKRKIKKILQNNGFVLEQNQSEYEKQMFGKTYKLETNHCI